MDLSSKIEKLTLHKWCLWSREEKLEDLDKSVCHVTYDTASFRALCGTLNKDKDVAVEIGCSYGRATKSLAKRLGASKVLGIDTSKEALAAASKRNPDVQFLRCDVLATPNTASDKIEELVHANTSCNLIVLVDIGGNRELEALTAVLPWVATLPTRPHRIIVKSQSLHTAANTHSNDDTREFPWDTILGLADVARQERERKSSGSKRKYADTTNSNERKFPHPLKAPLRTTADGTPICRYHNYQVCGCKLFLDPDKKGTTAECPCDHDHCHYCIVKGHIALNCTKYKPLI